MDEIRERVEMQLKVIDRSDSIKFRIRRILPKLSTRRQAIRDGF
jgi:hypothetical protein